MKKVANFILASAIVAVSLTSCEKEKIENPKAPVREEVKIFIKPQSGLKSATSENSSEIRNGDTVYFPRDVNVLMYAEDKYGQAITGKWMILQEVSDNPSGYYSNYLQAYYSGDQISHTFGEYGIYKVSFGKFVDWETTDTLMSFYVSVKGIPGKVGDDAINNSIFRLEKKELYGSDGLLHKLFFVYFKYKEEISEDQAYADFLIYKDEAGTTQNIDKRKMKKYPFSTENYFYCIIDPSQESGYSYEVRFEVSVDGGKSGGIDPNNYVSSWTNGYDGIVFSLQ